MSLRDNLAVLYHFEDNLTDATGHGYTAEEDGNPGYATNGAKFGKGLVDLSGIQSGIYNLYHLPGIWTQAFWLTVGTDCVAPTRLSCTGFHLDILTTGLDVALDAYVGQPGEIHLSSTALVPGYQVLLIVRNEYPTLKVRCRCAGSAEMNFDLEGSDDWTPPIIPAVWNLDVSAGAVADEMAIWTRALTDAECDLMYNSGDGVELLKSIVVTPSPAEASAAGLTTGGVAVLGTPIMLHARKRDYGLTVRQR